jgi:hypothetical protein
MTPPLDAYARARERLVAAEADLPAGYVQASGEDLPPEVAAHVEAGEAFRAAEAPLADQVQVAWDRNHAAYQAATGLVVDALREQARVETACGDAARRRDPRFPVLTEDEKRQVMAARGAVSHAKSARASAAEVVKAGVTADQIAEVD